MTTYDRSTHEESAIDGSPRLARRATLAALAGATAVALAGRSTPGYATPADSAAPDTITTGTLAELRAVAADGPPTWWVTDPGQEGVFALDAGDTTSTDNTGTVVVTAGAARYRRVFEGPVSVKWFGAAGDSVTDAADAIQAAVDVAQSTPARAVHFPAGSYPITRGIVINGLIPLRVSGDGWAQVTVKCHASVTELGALFRVVGTEKVFRHVFEGMYLACFSSENEDSSARVGIDIELGVECVFRDLRILFATEAGIRLKRGWTNVIERCLFSTGSNRRGVGIRLGPGQVNAISVVDCHLQVNSIGLELAGPERMQQIKVTGCVIEGNYGPGIHVAAPVKALDISNNYFELNHDEPFTVEGVAEPVHADIVTEPGLAMGPVRVAGNYVWIQKPWETEVQLVAAWTARGGLELSGNQVMHHNLHTGGFSLLRTGSAADDAAVERVRISQTYIEWLEDVQSPYVPIRLDSGGGTTLHQAWLEGTPIVNHSEELEGFAATGAGRTLGRMRAVEHRRNRREVWEMRGATVVDGWGFTLDVDTVTELRGALAYFAIEAQAVGDQAVVTASLGEATSEVILTDQDWHLVAVAVHMPESGQVQVGIGGEGIAQGLRLAHPVVSVVGAPYELHL